MFECTYRNVNGKLVRGGMAHDSPSHARRGVYVTRGACAGTSTAPSDPAPRHDRGPCRWPAPVYPWRLWHTWRDR
jgi:hypothetical protein